MNEYTISWTIQLDANTPREAALRALKIQRDKQSEALHFCVTDSEGGKHEVDFLLEDECSIEGGIAVLNTPSNTQNEGSCE